MSRDKALGFLMLLGSSVGVIVYGVLLFSLGEAVSLLTLQVTAFLAAASILGILAWIGYTLATTHPPKPIEEIEKEIEAELKGLEETETKEENLGTEGSETAANQRAPT